MRVLGRHSAVNRTHAFPLRNGLVQNRPPRTSDSDSEHPLLRDDLQTHRPFCANPRTFSEDEDGMGRLCRAVRTCSRLCAFDLASTADTGTWPAAPYPVCHF